LRIVLVPLAILIIALTLIGLGNAFGNSEPSSRFLPVAKYPCWQIPR